MDKSKICIFGGTTEGRLLAEFLYKNNVQADLFIATEYGQQFVCNLSSINVFQKRLDEEEMIKLFHEKNYKYVIDATHPYAKIVSENILSATTICNLEYIRVIRETLKDENCIYFDSILNCIDYLNSKKGNILLSTGSKDLDKFIKVKDYNKRIFVRILPMESSLKMSIDLGYLNKNIICMQGPFSEEMNIALINSTNSKFFVTKESGNSGGFIEKINACIKTGVECLVIGKPKEEGLTIEKVCNYIIQKGDLGYENG